MQVVWEIGKTCRGVTEWPGAGIEGRRGGEDRGGGRRKRTRGDEINSFLYFSPGTGVEFASLRREFSPGMHFS